MFDKYTEKARRVVFFARLEASQFGSSHIETEHILLGILREEKELINRFLRSNVSVESIRDRIEALSGKRKPHPPNQDLPLANESKRVLTYAAEEAKELASNTIGSEHIFLGLLRAKSGMAASLLNEHGIKIANVREEPPALPEPPKAAPARTQAPAPASAQQGPAQSAARAQALASSVASALAPASTPAPVAVPAPAPAPVLNPPPGLFRDLTQAAKDGVFDPIVGRDAEIDVIIEVLCSHQRRNPILVGILGAGKSGVVQGLAQRIVAGQVPAELANRRVIEVDPEILANWAKDRESFDPFLQLLATVSDPGETILFIDCFLRLTTTQTRERTQDFSGFLQWTLAQPDLRCIAAAEDREFPIAVQLSPWLTQDFRELRVRPLSEEGTLLALENRKPILEKFHGVTYDPAALEQAMRSATRDMAVSYLPRTAIELLDAAGVIARLRRGKPPAEVIEAQARLASLASQKKRAMQTHDVEKVRLLTEEERKEQENIKALQKKRLAKTTSTDTVTPEDIKAVIARWAAYPYSQ
jgi:ATP-dependent Clp protease ATP-binding subunit ClpC